MKKIKLNHKLGLDKKTIVGQSVFVETNSTNAKITDYNPETGEIEMEIEDEIFDAIVKQMSKPIGVSSRSCDCNDCKCDHNHTDDSGCNCEK